MCSLYLKKTLHSKIKCISTFWVSVQTAGKKSNCPLLFYWITLWIFLTQHSANFLNCLICQMHDFCSEIINIYILNSFCLDINRCSVQFFYIGWRFRKCETLCGVAQQSWVGRRYKLDIFCFFQWKTPADPR